MKPWLVATGGFGAGIEIGVLVSGLYLEHRYCVAVGIGIGFIAGQALVWLAAG
jgi:hypothetical protein